MPQPRRIFGVGATQTTSIFIFGTSMTATAGSVTETVTVPSSQVQTNQGGAPGAPTAVTPASLSGVMAALVAATTAGSTTTKSLIPILPNQAAPGSNQQTGSPSYSDRG